MTRYEKLLELEKTINELAKRIYEQEIAELVKSFNELKESSLLLEQENEKLNEQLRECKKLVNKKPKEHKFKVGDKIRFVGELSKDVRFLDDGEPRKILSIGYFSDKEFKAEFEGVYDYWLCNEDDFELVND